MSDPGRGKGLAHVAFPMVGRDLMSTEKLTFKVVVIVLLGLIGIVGIQAG